MQEAQQTKRADNDTVMGGDCYGSLSIVGLEKRSPTYKRRDALGLL